MPYCSNCGAYLPDGETKCVACGTVMVAESSSYGSSSAAFAQAPEAPKVPDFSDDLMEMLDAKRKEQEKKSKEWAEQAQAQYQQQSANTTSAHTGGKPSSEKKADGTVSPSTSKILAGLSYVSALFVIPFFCAKNDKFSIFHAKQGLILFLFSIIVDIVAKISGLLGLIGGAFRLYLIYKGIRNVLEEKTEFLPYIGKYAEKF